MSKNKKILKKAIEIAGGQKALAEKLGVPIKQQHVWKWLHKTKDGPPAKYVIPIEQATNGQVTRYDLRPDIYPRES